MKKPIILDYVRFRFFDTLGVQVGADAQFSNEEILGEIRELNTVSSTVLKSRAGLAASGANLHPLGFSFSITSREGATWNKIERLLAAVREQYRIEFSLLHGRRFWEPFGVPGTFLEQPTTFQSSILEFEEQDQRQITLGVGLKARTEFKLIVYEAISLALPSPGNSEPVEIGIVSIILGNGSSLPVQIIH